jgi:Fe2+ transport system protein B
VSDVVDFEVGAAAISAASSSRSVAERMKAEIAARKSAKAAVVELRHDALPELTITCKIPSDGEEVAELAQRADKRAKSNGTGTVWFNRLLVARFTIAIDWHGERLEDENGNAMTFASRGVQELVEASDAAAAVIGIYGSDAYVASIASQLMEKGGFGNDAAVEVVEDPTTGR